MLLTTQHICSSTGPAQKEALANSSKPVIPVHSCCVESSFCSVRLAQYSSTRVRVLVSLKQGNSEWWNMTGNEENVGFLGTGSGAQQFQLSLGGVVCLSVPPLLPGTESNQTHNQLSNCGCCPDKNRCFQLTGRGSRHTHIGRARNRSCEGIPVPVEGRE